MGVVPATKATAPLLPVNDIEVIFIEKASIQSDGAPPMLTWTVVLAADVGFEAGFMLPSQAVRIPARAMVTKTTMLFGKERF